MNFNPTVALWIAEASERKPSAVELLQLHASSETTASRSRRRRWLAPRLRLRLA